MIEEQQATTASDAFDTQQGFVPGRDSLSKVRNISENFPKNRVVCPGGRYTTKLKLCKDTRARDVVSCAVDLFLISLVSVLANFLSL